MTTEFVANLEKELQLLGLVQVNMFRSLFLRLCSVALNDHGADCSESPVENAKFIGSNSKGS